MERNLEKIKAIIDLFPNQKDILIGLENNLDLDLNYPEYKEVEGEKDRGIIISIMYNETHIHFVDTLKFLNSIKGDAK